MLSDERIRQIAEDIYCSEGTRAEIEYSIRNALAEAAQSVPVVEEVVEWQYRWLNPEEFTGQPASLLEWQRVIPNLSQSNEKRLEELLAYRSHGKACYEIRALVVQPATSIMQAELDAKDARILELEGALQGLLNIVNDSYGVDGYHLNGDVAHWSSFDEVAIAEAAIAAGEEMK